MSDSRDMSGSINQAVDSSSVPAVLSDEERTRRFDARYRWAILQEMAILREVVVLGGGELEALYIQVRDRVRRSLGSSGVPEEDTDVAAVKVWAGKISRLVAASAVKIDE